MVGTEQQAAQKFDPVDRAPAEQLEQGKQGRQPGVLPADSYAGGTHPVAKGANFGTDEWLYHRLSFMDKQLWVTQYNPEEKYPEGKYPNRSDKDSGLGQFTQDNHSIENTDDVVWLTTGTTHIARAERMADHADRVGACAAEAVELLR